MIIRHNTSVMNINRNLNMVSGAEVKRAEKLSSGYHINRAGDDAAGLAISEKMRAQIRGLTRASKNTMDAISLIQTAEGALQEAQNMLQRMNELAVQSANDTNAAMDRNALQSEVSQLIREIDEIAGSTRFNDVILLNGSFAKQTGAVFPNVIVFSENIFDVQTTHYPQYRNTFTASQQALADTLQSEIVPNAVTSIVNTFSDTFGYLNGSNVGIGLLLYENPDSTTVAAVQTRTFHTPGTPAIVELGYQLQVNMSFLAFNGGTITDASRTYLENTIAHEMMHALMIESLTAGMLGHNENMQATSRFPTWFIEGTAQAAAGAAQEAWTWLRIDETSSVAEIRNAFNTYNLSTVSSRSEYGTGYFATMYLGHLASGGDPSATSLSETAIADGLDKIMDEIRGGKSFNDAIADNTGGRYSGISDFQQKFANDGAAFAATLIAEAGANGTGGLITGDFTDTDILNDTPLAESLFGLVTTHEEIRNVYPDGYVVMAGGMGTHTGVIGPDHANGTGTTPGGTGGTGGGTGGTTPGGGTGGGTGGGGTTAPVTPKGGIVIQTGAEAGNDTTLFIEAMTSAGLGINGVNISTRLGATSAISTLRGAINKISTQRADLGAYQNRMEYKVNNLGNVTENLQAAESRIRDTDMAKEMAEFSKQGILRQAGYAILAQAQLTTQSVLSLLG